jgi:hypothetical protein
VQWKNGFNVLCCSKAFAVDSGCKFAFCPPCLIKKSEVLNPGGSGRGKRAKRGSSCNANGAVKDAATKKNGNKKGGGCDGLHTMMDVLTLEHTNTSKSWLAERNVNAEGYDNIVVNCIFCGNKF